MRYFARFKGDKEFVPVELSQLADGRYAVVVGGKTHEVDALTLDHGAVSLLVDHESFSAEFDPGKDFVAVHLGKQVTWVEVADERTLRLRSARAGFSAQGRQSITAPMPGKVVRVLVKEGEAVGEGQGLVVVEAMKMENELKSPKAGKVLALKTREGSLVEQNAELVVVE